MRADLTLEEIAAHVHLSPSRFNHVFLAAVGQSPIKWLNGQKLKNAKRLLESTELSILQVAQRSGFVDPNYFSKFFRQQTGLSPQQYRSGAEVTGPKVAEAKAGQKEAEAEEVKAKAVSSNSSEA